MVRELTPRQVFPPTKYVKGVGIATDYNAHFPLKDP
ncbi:UNVERIFIED_ORG: hypothetical protein QFZ59_001052 [Bacillus sp. B2I3]|nr:hypothetical protein [Bacillus sp. B2I3]